MATQEKEMVKTAPVSKQPELARLPALLPRADVYETEKDIRLFVELPGVPEGKLDIKVEKNILALVGTMELPVSGELQPTYREFQGGRFERQFILPDLIDVGRIEASLVNGVLALTLPKAEAALPRKITVKTV